MTKFGDSIRQLVASLGRWDGPTRQDIEKVSKGLEEEFGARTREHIYRWRASGLLKLRAFKEASQASQP